MIKEKIKKFLSEIKLSGISAIIGFIGAYAGSEGTSLLWRRCGISLIFTVCALIEIKSLWVILLMSIWGALSIGYGIPENLIYNINKKLVILPEGDEGSTLARFWYKITKGSHLWTDILTRGTVALIISIAFLVIPILKGNWIWYLIGSLGIILVYAVNSWRGYGVFEVTFKGKKYYLLKVDFVTYSVLGICGLMIIYKG